MRANTIRLHSLNWKCLLELSQTGPLQFAILWHWSQCGLITSNETYSIDSFESPELNAVCFQLGLSVTVCFGTWTQRYKDINPVTLRLWNNECWNALSLSTALALRSTRSPRSHNLSAAAALTLAIVPLCTLKFIYVVCKYAVRTSQRTHSATVRKVRSVLCRGMTVCCTN